MTFFIICLAILAMAWLIRSVRKSIRQDTERAKLLEAQQRRDHQRREQYGATDDPPR